MRWIASFQRFTFVGRFVSLLFLPVVVGCGPGQGKLTGHVSFNGAPLPGGVLFFRPADTKENSISAAVDEQGNYSTVLPAGEVQISIDNRELRPRDPASHGIPRNLPPKVQQALEKALKETPKKPAEAAVNPRPRPTMPGKYVEIPRRYYDITTSSLQFTVQRGDQTHDIELTK
jgi:hypothetical protein